MIRFKDVKKQFIALCIVSLATAMLATDASGCTSAIVSASASPYGRPMLWKNRDTSNADNKVEYVPSTNGSHAYVALFNADDKNLEEAWIGMNDVGFAVMNTASYNLKDDNVAKKKMDREGFVMSIALSSCKTVDDFARLLDTLPRPMGVEANFGVIDATGAGAYFEANNHSYTRYDLADDESGVIVRTNYSHSGRPNEGYGFIREANALHLLDPYVKNRAVTPELFTEHLSRSFYHDLLKKDFVNENEAWVIDQDFIPRYTSTATVVIEGCKPVEDIDDIRPFDLKDEYIMWTGLGYPPCSEIVPVWCSADGVSPELRGISANGHSEMADKVKERRSEVFSIHKGNGEKYIDFAKLFNDRGTGYVQLLRPRNLDTYNVVRKHRDGYRREKNAN